MIYYYSIRGWNLEELQSFLQNCQKQYKDLEIWVFSSPTRAWIKSNKNLSTLLENSTFKYKYLILKIEPIPETRLKGKWIKLKSIKT